MSIYQSPILLLIILSFLIFITESFVMFLLSFLPSLSTSPRAYFLDAALLIILLFPALYIFMLSPLIKARDELEMQVKERTAELRDNEKRYRSLFEQSPYGIVIVDTETAKAVEFNDVAHNQLGYSREEFAGLRVSDYEAKEKPEETKSHIEKVLREGRDTFETTHKTKEGEIKNIWVSVQKIEISGKPYFYAIFHDITERKRAEEEIKTLKGLIPICASCKKIRNDKGYWERIESYIRKHSDAEFTHTICPECAKKLYPDIYGG
ncbi:MAG: PAS domain S-box protein [Nitrospinae bacterium]|nr:PAS domain S-box protein [Nitrospinota bacterium]